MAELSKLEIEGPVSRLSLNRPEKRNALSLDLLASLRADVERVRSACERGDGPSVLVLTGEGRSFCAGMDLKAVLSQPGEPLRLLQSIAELTIALRTLPTVVVGRINGAAIGGGCGLVAVCDVAVTHPDAKLGFPEVDLGVCPAVVAPWLVSKIGAGAARRVLLSGGTMSGLEAHDCGLVSHCVPSEELDETVEGIVERIASAGPRALAATKAHLNASEQAAGLYDGVRKGAAVSADVIAGEEAQLRLNRLYG